MSSYSNYLSSKRCCDLRGLGPQGPAGITGPQGTKGNMGDQGVTGPQGFQGSTGVGCRGPQGYQGVTGPSGGAQGVTGAQGPPGGGTGSGVQGAQGFQGVQGAQGFQGVVGVTGAQGFQGFQGVAGVTGAQGFTGARGVTGAQGFTGARGVTGAQGFTGAQGVTGAQGFQGDTGAQGFQGPSFVINSINQDAFSKTTKLNSINYSNQTSIKTSGVNAELDNFTDNQQVYTFGPTIQNRWVSVGNSPSISYSSDGLNWFPANDTLFFKNAYGVEWNGTLWVAVGDNSGGTGTNNSICYSYDGIIWNPSQNPPAFNIGYCVAWNGNMWIAGGQAGGSNMWYSYDGMNWGKNGSPDIDIVYDIAWNGNIWVAVGQPGSTSIVYSYDGFLWTSSTNAFSVGYGVAWNGNMWIAVGVPGGSLTSQICYSYDGITWVDAANPFSSQGRDVKWNGILWVATGDGANPIVYSYDGIVWTNCTISVLSFSLGTYNSLCWNGTRWVALDSTNTNFLVYSNNGINWVVKQNTQQFGYGIAYNGKREQTLTFPKNRLVAVGNNYTLYSDDGNIWTAANSTPFKTGYGIDWNGKMWVAVGSNDPNTSIAYSYNGSDWTNATNMFQQGRGVKWNGTMWVAVGVENTSQSILNINAAYSYDGICWKSSFNNPFKDNGYSIDWNGTIWVAGGDSNSIPLAYSSDGDTWNPVPIFPGSLFNCYTVVWNGTIWVAGGDGSNLLYSYDGLNWYQSTIIPSPFNIYNSAAWNGSMFLIGGDTGPFIAYSYDGILWDTVNVTFPPLAIINGITWDGNKWIAVGMNPSTGLVAIYYSCDGFAWTQSTTTTPIDDVYGVAWNKNLGSTYIQQPVISLGIGNYNTIAYSLDGIKYTGLGNNQNKLLHIGYAAAWNGNMWVATGEDASYSIIYSYDGIEWILINNSSTYINPGNAVVWTGINWVVAGKDAAGICIYYSPDGINWFPSGISGGWCRGIATDVKTISGGTPSTTVAVGDNSNPGIVYSVDDGVNWTTATNLPPANLYCVAWNGTTWLSGGDSSSQLYWSLDGITWDTTPINIEPSYTLFINSIAWNGVVWVAVCNYNTGIRIYYTSVLNGQTGWTSANILVSGGPIVDLYSVIWNGKRWIAGGQDSNVPKSYIFKSHDGINWVESPPVTAPPNPYNNPLNTSVYGLASNSGIGGVIVDSQIALNKNNSVNLTTKLDIYSDNYYNNGYNNMVVSVKSNDLL